MLQITTFLIFLSVLSPLKAQATRPLFNAQEKARLSYLKSPQFLADNLNNTMNEESRKRMGIALKLYAKMDLEKHREFFKKDIWAQEDARETYFALHKWLHIISPLKNLKENK